MPAEPQLILLPTGQTGIPHPCNLDKVEELTQVRHCLWFQGAGVDEALDIDLALPLFQPQPAPMPKQPGRFAKGFLGPHLGGVVDMLPMPNFAGKCHSCSYLHSISPNLIACTGWGCRYAHAQVCGLVPRRSCLHVDSIADCATAAQEMKIRWRRITEGHEHAMHCKHRHGRVGFV